MSKLKQNEILSLRFHFSSRDYWYKNAINKNGFHSTINGDKLVAASPVERTHGARDGRVNKCYAKLFVGWNNVDEREGWIRTAICMNNCQRIASFVAICLSEWLHARLAIRRGEKKNTCPTLVPPLIKLSIACLSRNAIIFIRHRRARGQL